MGIHVTRPHVSFRQPKDLAEVKGKVSVLVKDSEVVLQLTFPIFNQGNYLSLTLKGKSGDVLYFS